MLPKDREDSHSLPLKPKKTVQEKFRNYLSLIFSDLCAKDNGLNAQRVHQYTFLKVRLPLLQRIKLIHIICSTLGCPDIWVRSCLMRWGPNSNRSSCRTRSWRLPRRPQMLRSEGHQTVIRVNLSQLMVRAFNIRQRTSTLCLRINNLSSKMTVSPLTSTSRGKASLKRFLPCISGRKRSGLAWYLACKIGKLRLLYRLDVHAHGSLVRKNIRIILHHCLIVRNTTQCELFRWIWSVSTNSCPRRSSQKCKYKQPS